MFLIKLRRGDDHFEDISEYKKWEHHFDYLVGELKQHYYDVKVEFHSGDSTTRPYLEVTGNMDSYPEDFEAIVSDNALESYGFDDVEVIIREESKIKAIQPLKKLLKDKCPYYDEKKKLEHDRDDHPEYEVYQLCFADCDMQNCIPESCIHYYKDYTSCSRYIRRRNKRNKEENKSYKT